MNKNITLLLITFFGTFPLSSGINRKRTHEISEDDYSKQHKKKPEEELTSELEKLLVSPQKRFASTLEKNAKNESYKKNRTTSEKDLRISQAQIFLNLLEKQEYAQLLEKDDLGQVRTNNYTFGLVKQHHAILSSLLKQPENKSDEQILELLKMLNTIERIGYRSLPFS